jgi:hypothetical protein
LLIFFKIYVPEREKTVFDLTNRVQCFSFFRCLLFVTLPGGRKSSISFITIKIIIAMKSLSIAAVTAVTLLSGCSVYRSGQTPDDVYYSPGKAQVQPAYVEANGDRDDGKRYNDNRTYNGYDDYANADDRWLMMRVRNRYSRLMLKRTETATMASATTTTAPTMDMMTMPMQTTAG